MGYGNLLQRIADKYNLPIRLNTLVTQINTTDKNRIEIKIANNSSIICCRRLIITIPLGCLKHETILFEPPLPDWKRDAINRIGMGLMNKLILQFPNHFWDSNVRAISHASKPTSDGRVQWADEHANTDDGTKYWSYGCVHSAFQSGQRAVKAIRDELCSS